MSATSARTNLILAGVPELQSCGSTRPASSSTDADAGEAAHWGNVLEPIVATEYGRGTGRIVRLSPGTLRDPEYPFMLAIDGD